METTRTGDSSRPWQTCRADRDLQHHRRRRLLLDHDQERVGVGRHVVVREPRYLAVDVTSAVCREAGALAERHALRGYGSVHLAAFLHLARAAGKAAVRFSCFDDRLTRATRTALRVLQPAGR